MEIESWGFATLTGPVEDSNSRLSIPLRIAYEEFDPRTLSFVEARVPGDAPLRVAPEVEIRSRDRDQVIPYPVTLREEGGQHVNTLVFGFAVESVPTDGLLNGDFDAVLTFGSLRSIVLRITLAQTESGKAIHAKCLPIGSASGVMLRNALMIALSCAILGAWYSWTESGVLSEYEGWMLSKAKLSLYAGIVLGFFGLQFQFLSLLLSHLAGWRAFARFPQLYLDSSVIWFLSRRLTTAILVAVNVVVAWRVGAEWPASVPKLGTELLTYWNERSQLGFNGPARIWASALGDVSVRCGTEPRGRPALAHVPVRSVWPVELAFYPTPVFASFLIRAEPGMGIPQVELTGEALAALDKDQRDLPGQVAGAIHAYVCGRTAPSGLPLVVSASAGEVSIRWREKVRTQDLEFAVGAILDRLGTRSVSASGSCYSDPACRKELEDVIPKSGAIEAAVLMEVIESKLAPRFQASADQKAMINGLVALRVLFSRFRESHGTDLSDPEIERLAQMLSAAPPIRNDAIANALIGLSTDLQRDYASTVNCVIEKTVQAALATAGGGIYVSYLTSSAEKGLLADDSPCVAERRDWLGKRAPRMREMKSFPGALEAAVIAAPGAAGFLESLRNSG